MNKSLKIQIEHLFHAVVNTTYHNILI